MSTLGAVVFSIRGMKHLSECLDSVRWVDEVAVRHLDQEAAEGGHYSGQMGTDWVLHLWGEERVGAELREELHQIRHAELPAEPTSYLIPIRSHLLGRWVKGSLWDPASSPRLCRQVEEPPFGGWSPASKNSWGTTGLLRGWIEDYSCSELRDGVDRVNSVSSLWAERLRSEGPRLSNVAMTVYPLRVLMRHLFIDGLFREGLAGLSLSALAAYVTLASAMKLWEARQSGSRGKGLS